MTAFGGVHVLGFGCTWLEFCVIGCMWLWFGCMCDWTLGSRVVEDEVYMTLCEGVYMSVF